MIFINDDIDKIDISASLNFLPAERKKKALSYRSELQQRQCIGAWLLLRKACIEVFHLPDVPQVALGRHGKPFFPSLPRLHFNLSHCRVAVACVVDKVPVGIDIECPRSFSENLLAYTCSPDECRAVLDSDNPFLTFATLWTKKESLFKLTGEGIRDNLQTILSECTDVVFDTRVSNNERYVCTTAKYISCH